MLFILDVLVWVEKVCWWRWFCGDECSQVYGLEVLLDGSVKKERGRTWCIEGRLII